MSVLDVVGHKSATATAQVVDNGAAVAPREHELVAGVGRGNEARSGGTRRSYEWTGLEYGPLPHESVICTYNRFCYLNVLTLGTAKRIFKVRIAAKGGLFRQNARLDATHLKSVTGWELSDAQTATSRALPNLASLLFSDSLRVCYSCLADGYHSSWHQFRTLARCPIHDEELSGACACCGEMLTFSGESQYKALNDKTLFCCPSCGDPPGYRAFSTERHRAMRTNTARLEHAFAHLQQWLEGAQSKLWELEQLIEQHDPVVWTTWCNPRDFLLGLIDLLHPFPDGARPLHSVSVAAVSWRQLRAQLSRGTQDRPDSESVLKRSVYASVLRRLQVGIYGTETPRRVLLDLDDLFAREGLNSHARDSNEIALALFRAWYEPYFKRPLSQSDARNVVLNEKFPGLHFEGYVPRSAQRAVLLGSFAVFAQMVRIGKGRTYHGSEFADDVFSLKYLLPLVHLPALDINARRSEFSEGVVFYIVPECPLSRIPFD
ncbi:hypothetical protein [Paraburkholderia sp. 32]|uniref:hypothetical protein n=1 Tax=Paraburkholderia sp. 32 TaxID=2991057 RepID=UPI003D19735F